LNLKESQANMNQKSSSNNLSASNNNISSNSSNNSSSDEKLNRNANEIISNKREFHSSSNSDFSKITTNGHGNNSNHNNDVIHPPAIMMPHDKNALNFLINEYLLENNYKMTSVTFSEENESQDLEDWDVVGLNRAKPPKLFQLYKSYLTKNNSHEDDSIVKKAKESKNKNIQKETPSKECVDEEIQCAVDLNSSETNTNLIDVKNFESLVNFDREIFDNQHSQINKLLEKQDILLKNIAKLEKEISNLNSERESNLKKIDFL
jgi:hypothetical protein